MVAIGYAPHAVRHPAPSRGAPMSSRLLIVLLTLGILAAGGGVAGGLLLARDPGPDPALAGPTTLPGTTLPAAEPSTSTASTTSTSSTSTTSTSTSAALAVRARVVERLEDGVVVRYDATEPVSAVLSWGFGAPSGNQLRFPGPATQGTVKLVLTETASAVSMRVTGPSADGRTDSSATLTARRLLRQVVVEVSSLSLDIPSGTGGIATTFRGTTYTPIGPSVAGPIATAEPYAFPAAVLDAGEQAGTLALRFFHQISPAPQRTRLVTVTVPFPNAGSSTLTRDVTAIGLTAHLRLRVTASLS
jgi:hypothetical protein